MPLEFGDARYDTAPATPRAAHHPHQRCSGLVLANGLVGAYSYGQQVTRLLGAWAPPHRQGRVVFGDAEFVSTELTLGSARVWLAEHLTHLRADYVMGIREDRPYAWTVALTVDGTELETQDETAESPDYGDLVGRSIEAPVKPASGGEWVDVTLTLTRGGATSRLYSPHSVVWSGECRDG